MRIRRNKTLTLSLSDKINISTINEILEGKKQTDIANNYGITQGRVAQIYGDWKNGILFIVMASNEVLEYFHFILNLI